MLEALKYRNFRLFIFGQSVSLVGTWIQQVAMSWLIYRMTNEVFLLGLVGFFSQIPSFFLSPVAGVFTDRWNLRPDNSPHTEPGDAPSPGAGRTHPDRHGHHHAILALSVAGVRDGLRHTRSPGLF